MTQSWPFVVKQLFFHTPTMAKIKLISSGGSDGVEYYLIDIFIDIFFTIFQKEATQTVEVILYFFVSFRLFCIGIPRVTANYMLW